MPSPEEKAQSLGEMIVRGRLLILQSKRMLLGRAVNRARSGRSGDHEEAVSRLDSDVRVAQDRYRDSILKWGSTSSGQFWLVAYAALVEEAEGLSSSMRRAARDLPRSERREVESDATTLDEIIAGWRSLGRAAISKDVA